MSTVGPVPQLGDLLPRLAHDPGLHCLQADRGPDGAPGPQRVSILEAARPAALAALHRALGRPTLLLVSRLGRARQLAEEVAFWLAAPDQVYLFPELDALPYERLLAGPEHRFERLRTMLALAATEPPPPSAEPQRTASAPFVVVTARAAMDRLMWPDDCRSSTWRVAVGDRIRPDQLVGAWVQAGYEPVSIVERPGEFARRGGIIDVFPCGGTVTLDAAGPTESAARVDDILTPPHPRPAVVSAFRIELWGNDVDSIRVLDPATQRSTEAVRAFTIGPAHEVLARPLTDPGAFGSLRLDHLHGRTRDALEEELRMLAAGQPFAYLDWYRGWLGTGSILDYLPAHGLLIVDEPGSVAGTARELHRQAEQFAVDLLERGEAPGNLPRPYWLSDELEARLAGAAPHRIDLVLDPDALATGFEPAPTYSGRLPHLFADLADASARSNRSATTATPCIVVVSQQSARLEELLQAALPASAVERALGSTRLVHGSLSEGWANSSLGLTVLTDRELFGWAKIRRTMRRPGVAARERFLSDLEVDELVVHIDHGIGRYRGLVRLRDRATGIEREYLDIEYSENDRLRVPVDHADRVSRYIGAGEAVPALTRLGSSDWQRTKQRIRSAVHRIARELVELYASRELATAVALGPDSPWQMELEAAFPFIETPDQLQAVQEVKADLERPRPMDRLLVGDVGYGKTEVALRAAFKAVNAGRQVAILVPTTVLAQQHFTTFRERLAPFPVRVEMLSRFLSDREARNVVRGMREGWVDIVIGTHRLLQRDVEFQNLALVIIDEEQRFGVMHKDRFKQLRTEVHVLSLSATPIPRTLHLSLVGVRDLSMIQTAPEDRLPIRTYVTEHDDRLVREAILREIDRGGQVFYVSNRVVSIGSVAARLAALVPEARIAIGHGQMSDDELEDTMLRFAGGDADVLVCTTIIEAGLDLPNVNTIIVTNADQFGLSQLYQLRGRVGRGSDRAYAYFLYDRNRQLTEVAEKRLRAIFEATELGAGYRIALKDLEIRGAGNLLGVEQHGHISAVGFNLYCCLLGEAVAQLKALREQALSPEGLAAQVLQQALQDWRPASLQIPLTMSLPDDYVADPAARLSLYQRLAAVRDGPALGDLIAEIEDRFGPAPEPAMHLFYLLSLRLAATAAGIDEILLDGDQFVLRFRQPTPIDVPALGRRLGCALQARANQVRFTRGPGASWMPTLRNLVDALASPPGASAR